jgi:hypothetical protein
MATPDPSNVAPWYLRNINQALELNEATGQVFVRTGFEGNIIITGNVNIPGNVDAHISEIGTSGNLTVPYMPIAGNITIDTGQSVGITGNVNIGTMPNVNANITGGNVTVSGNVTIPTDVTQADSTYEMNVARGLVTGQYSELKNGYATGISQDTETTIWNQTVLYPWSSWTVAQKLYIISTSASDTGQTLRIEGLDASYNKITENVTTNGTSAVATTQNFLRLNRSYIIAGISNVGTITERLTSGSGTVVGSMAIGFSRNKGGFFTVPNGYTAYILYGDATQFRGGAGNIGGVIKMYTRTGSGPFINQFMAEVVNGQYRNDFTIPLALPEKTDIDVRIIADGNNTQATCNWQMILIPN